jgi:hypothetical protein
VELAVGEPAIVVDAGERRAIRPLLRGVREPPGDREG